jgi:hypothetical protein
MPTWRAPEPEAEAKNFAGTLTITGTGSTVVPAIGSAATRIGIFPGDRASLMTSAAEKTRSRGESAPNDCES